MPCGKDVKNHRIHNKTVLNFILIFVRSIVFMKTQLGKVVGHLSSPGSPHVKQMLLRMVLRAKQAVPEKTFQLLSFRELDILVPHRFCALGVHSLRRSGEKSLSFEL